MNTPETVHLFGGSLSLDFANSVDWSASGEPIKDEVLRAPRDLGAWGARLGLGRVRGIDSLELAAALALREAVHVTFAAVALEEVPAAAALALIAAVHADGVGAGSLVPDGGDAWRMRWPASDPRRVRFAVAADAVALLGDADRLSRVRHCPGHDCGWLFLDTSGRRRWCSMETCGSRAKMKRLYERKRAAAS